MLTRIGAPGSMGSARPIDRQRVDEAVARDLGIHSAITTPDAIDELPTYVERDFDFRLRAALAPNVDRGPFVVMLGSSSTGKTRSLYEAVREMYPDWWLIQPPHAGYLLELKNDPPGRTVFWLDELQQYLGGREPLTAECVRTLIRRGNVVVGTVWPSQLGNLTSASEDIRRLMRSAVQISVPAELTTAELNQARGVAERDSRIRQALDTRDAGLTQALAGGPALVMAWEQPANPYAKAIITAAADAHRLGVHAPLSEELLARAMFGYLQPKQRVEPARVWIEEAKPHATKPLYGDVSPLSPVDGGEPGSLAGYVVADYLAQHLRRVRRTAPVPGEAWQAFVRGMDRPSDLRRLADAALARMRYCYAEPALRRLATDGHDAQAAIELADLLIRQGRFEPAVDVLRRRHDADPGDDAIKRRLARAEELWDRIEKLRLAAEAGNPAARDRIEEILVDCGLSDDLRMREEQGDLIAAERLVERLADRGCVAEIHERADQGQVFAGEALADLYVAWGDIDRLRARAKKGDRTAERRLSRVRSAKARAAAAAIEREELRAAVDEGKPEAAVQLSALLFELRDLDGLTAELDAGTEGAADRLLALHTATNTPPEWTARLRAYGLNADGSELLGPDTFPQ
ncbi:tetratricopeptide repeat protein [Paractinoplanes globisporus]|uniref:Tetratricopeptide repeat protein n=1 Tax=Paractinoplanes globisporus TaxID=113565 RepID=A0ABW6W3D1_9ACTN|nr:tetratricopeptide repeat protein [Actinoplanes globisporus]